jgi:DNA segregation ATPase FtsK/SpoIIIE, S-DNA-T family
MTPRPSLLREHADEAFDPFDPGFDAALARSDDRLAVLVDDAELVADCVAAAVLDRLMRSARDAGHVIALAGTTEDLSVGFRGFIVDARRSRTGLLLSPRGAFDGEVLGLRLPRGTGGTTPAGRGILVAQGSATPIQVALPPSSR